MRMKAHNARRAGRKLFRAFDHQPTFAVCNGSPGRVILVRIRRTDFDEGTIPGDQMLQKDFNNAIFAVLAESTELP
jgi:hypothetical protein